MNLSFFDWLIVLFLLVGMFYSVHISKKYNSHGSFDYNLLGLDSKYILILKNGKPIPGKFRDRIDLDHFNVFKC